MKKILYVLAIVATLAMVSCGNKTKKAAAAEEVTTEQTCPETEGCSGDCASCPSAAGETAAE